MRTFKVLIIVTLAVCFTLNAQQTPAKKQMKTIAISGATAHLGNGSLIKNSLVVFDNGTIQYVGKMDASKLNSEIEIIDAKGKHVYPGFIIPNSTLGLIEIDAVRASDDDEEIGTWNPHIRSIIAYNTESRVVETMRPNGVLMAQITPRGGRISGTSSVVQLDAWNWEDAVVKIDDGIHMNWPNTFSRGRWWMGEEPGLKINKKYADELQELNAYFNNAKVHNIKASPGLNLPFEAMKGVFSGHQSLFIHVDDEKGIIDAINFTKQYKIENVVLVGAYEAYKQTELIKENDVSVLLRRVHSRPNKSDEDYDLPFKLAKKLVDAGVTVALEASGDMERMNSRNLPFYAGTTVAYGLDKEQALQLITLNAAKILGIDAQYGSLETGKSATLFISQGDALDMRTNQLEYAFIDGRNISLESHQTKLWKRYTEKYKNQ
ncbi:MAG: amidohydrolase family protein [Bacteroidetes bacterium]|nr:amidohydrolase family protein [Bacteroidota bacterium]